MVSALGSERATIGYRWQGEKQKKQGDKDVNIRNVLVFRHL